MKELYERIGNFAFNVFPEAKSEHHILKLINEANEVIENPSDVFEYADCLICLFAAANKQGIGFSELLVTTEQKLDINLNRKWVKLPDGTFQHVK